MDQLAQASFCLFHYFSLLILSVELCCSHTIFLVFFVAKAKKLGKVINFNVVFENIKMVIETMILF